MSTRSLGKYPIFKALGASQEFLGPEEAAQADRDTRIRSVWPFIVRRARLFHESLKPRERVNFDPEDIAIELWVALAKKDHLWSPARGKYITFAGVIIDRVLYDLRDQARTVESPRNSSCRMKEYLEEEAAGTITPRRRRTADDIRRTGSGTESIGLRRDMEDGVACDYREPAEILMSGEITADRRAAIVAAIRKLTPSEAAILGRLAGLWGRPSETPFWVGWTTAREAAEIRRTMANALAKIRKYLSSNHPSITSGA